LVLGEKGRRLWLEKTGIRVLWKPLCEREIKGVAGRKRALIRGEPSLAWNGKRGLLVVDNRKEKTKIS